MLWEQWSGILTLQDLGLSTSWKPLALKHLAHRKAILHTDSAKSYKAKVPGMVRDAVVHAKKKVRKGNKTSWKAPQYVRVVSHKLPDGRILKVKAGAQHIDRAWRFLKDCLYAGTSM